jgi:hypothetical protein
VLARTFEAKGLSTIMVTMMSFWAEKVGVPRTLAVEFPFGHTLGQPHNVDQQMRVIRHALKVLEREDAPGSIVHSTETWPEPVDEAKANWQPDEPSPIIEVMTPQVLKLLRQTRREKS